MSVLTLYFVAYEGQGNEVSTSLFHSFPSLTSSRRSPKTVRSTVDCTDGAIRPANAKLWSGGSSHADVVIMLHCPRSKKRLYYEVVNPTQICNCSCFHLREEDIDTGTSCREVEWISVFGIGKASNEDKVCLSALRSRMEAGRN